MYVHEQSLSPNFDVFCLWQRLEFNLIFSDQNDLSWQRRYLTTNYFNGRFSIFKMGTRLYDDNFLHEHLSKNAFVPPYKTTHVELFFVASVTG